MDYFTIISIIAPIALIRNIVLVFLIAIVVLVSAISSSHSSLMMGLNTSETGNFSWPDLHQTLGCRWTKSPTPTNCYTQPSKNSKSPRFQIHKYPQHHLGFHDKKTDAPADLSISLSPELDVCGQNATPSETSNTFFARS